VLVPSREVHCRGPGNGITFSMAPASGAALSGSRWRRVGAAKPAARQSISTR
jgi:hypothetical protein